MHSHTRWFIQELESEVASGGHQDRKIFELARAQAARDSGVNSGQKQTGAMEKQMAEKDASIKKMKTQEQARSNPWC
jgi:hypothetical protein